MRWVAPFRVKDLLERCLDYKNQKWPPDDNGVYVVSLKAWEDIPDKKCIPLYVGSTTGVSPRFRTRVGDLIADIFGFYSDDEIGHHSGGISIHKHCKRNRIIPLDLFIGWAEKCSCVRCSEIEIYKRLKPILNKKSPPACVRHH
jgi:hypothetical protein